jgi:soluble lytic murein transglycosylase-like protein
MGKHEKRERRHGGAVQRFALGLVRLSVATALLSLTALAGSDSRPHGIVAVQENGKTVWVNAEEAQSPASGKTHAVASSGRSSRLVFWSTKEKRWKPVPAPPPGAMNAARNAAAEVANYIESKPKSTKPTQTVRNPNYRDVARGYAVSATDIDSAIEAAAKRHDVDPNLIRAIVKTESNFNPNAVSRKGAMGLMQLMPETARSLKVQNPFDPKQNVDAGVRYFKNLMDNYNGDLKLSLAAYNAGSGAVARSNGVPHIPETQNYVKQITNMYWNGSGGFGASGRTFSSPVHVFRDANGTLTMTNDD